MSNDLIPGDWLKRYLTIWFGQGVSTLTTSIVQMAIIWYITDKTKSAAVLSTAVLIGYVPQAVLGLFIGILIDRYSRKKIMIISDIIMSLSCVVLILSGMTGEIPIWLILAVLCIRSIGGAFYQPSLQAMMPQIIPEDRITEFAGYSQSFENVSMLISPALAVILYGIFPLHGILVLDVIGAAVAVFTLAITEIPRLPKSEKNGTDIIAEAKEGFKVIHSVKGIKELLIMGALYAVIYFPIGTLYPFISLNYFNSGVRGSGIAETVFSSGTLMGSLLLGVFGGRINKIYSLTISMAAYGLGCTVIGLMPPEGFWVFLFMSLIMGISVPFYFGIETAIFQTRVPGEYLGRVISLSSSVCTVTMPVGMILSGIFVDHIGINIWFLVCGIATVIIAATPFVLKDMKSLA